MTTSEPKNIENEFSATVLNEDGFGIYWDQHGKSHEIKRFTWKNRNKIEVQVINYGARIVAMKIPDRKGKIDDIVLGFDDLTGYIFYQSYYIGATIGRMSHVVRNGSFVLNKQEYHLTKNRGKHHLNGGQLGLDQAVWDTHIKDKKVIMSHISKHLSEGYPGDVFVRITFELSDMNEFKIDMEAFATQPTLINLSNLTYFNLAGQHRGPDDIYRHIVTVNADCFLKQEDGLPTGDICNVANHLFDFQVPKLLGKLMGISPGDGFKEYLCINKGTNQDNCFIGRAIHNHSGRVLEVYSNQPCICFSTANEFGYGQVLSMQQLTSIPQGITKACPESQQYCSKPVDDYLQFLKYVHSKLEQHLQEDKEDNYEDLRSLIRKMGRKEQMISPTTPTNSPIGSNAVVQPSIMGLVFTERQKNYLKGIYRFVMSEEGQLCQRLKETIQKLLSFSIVAIDESSALKSIGSQEEGNNKSKTSLVTEIRGSIPKILNIKEIKTNEMPSYYKKGSQIIGKERAIYRVHSGIALQTHNFPCSENFKNFPSSILNPGENYKHTITYKFWIRAGNPSRWIKKKKHEMEKTI